MRKIALTISNTTGLHARPARILVDMAKRFQSTIRLGNGEKLVNGKSLLSVLTLGIRREQTISIEIEGADEIEASEALEKAVRSGLGEDLATARESAPVSAAAPAGESDARGADVRTDGTVKVVHGVPGAPGIAVGPVHQLRHVEIAVQEGTAEPAQELVRLEAALEVARDQLSGLREVMALRGAGYEASIFEVHRDVLMDPDLLARVQKNIRFGQSAAEGWQTAINQYASELADLPDELLAGRALDVRDVGERVLRLLVKLEAPATCMPDEPFVLIAHDLRPSDAAMLDPQRVLGFCTAIGGPHAHTAILARALGLPAVVSAGPLVLDLPDGSPVILDGRAGTITIAPNGEEVATARAVQRRKTEPEEVDEEAAEQPAVTPDGHGIDVVANVGSLADARAAARAGADGIGLLRTELLFLARTAPAPEEEQFAVYRDIVKAMEGKPVIVRTLDVGGDKPLPYLHLPVETNPFLGERGIRLSLARPDLFRPQLRAILRAAAFGPVRILFPMITDIHDIRAARQILETVRAEIDAPAVEVGVMVEVPSAALMADVLAPEIDFFSIGTNDLTQYALAMDRTHPTLATRADGLHPAVLRLIDATVRAARATGKRVAVCGELASDPEAIPILLGLGVNELSISVSAVPAVKAQIRSLNIAQCRQHAARALDCATSEEIREWSR